MGQEPASSPPAFPAPFLYLLVLVSGLWGCQFLVDGGSPVTEQVPASLLGSVQAACCVTVPSRYRHLFCGA